MAEQMIELRDGTTAPRAEAVIMQIIVVGIFETSPLMSELLNQCYQEKKAIPHMFQYRLCELGVVNQDGTVPDLVGRLVGSMVFTDDHGDYAIRSPFPDLTGLEAMDEGEVLEHHVGHPTPAHYVLSKRMGVVRFSINGREAWDSTSHV